MKCRICGSRRIAEVIAVKEMMIGLQDEFEYFACADCGCLQISKFPDDISKYYGEEYYSFKTLDLKSNNLFEYTRKCYYQYMFKRKGLIGGILHKIIPSVPFLPFCQIFNITEELSILDVGCGAGYLLNQLSLIGYKNLTGVDKFLSDIPNSINYRLIKGEIKDIDGKFEVIMLHHSLEHMPMQHDVMQALYNLLSPQGILIIRIPVINEAYRLYRENWFQIDAPRHFYLHTLKSMEYLATANGFKVDKIFFDSSEKQFLDSIKYSKGVTLFDFYDFPKKDKAKYRQMAEKFNQEGKGDQACFGLRKSHV